MKSERKSAQLNRLLQIYFQEEARSQLMLTTEINLKQIWTNFVSAVICVRCAMWVTLRKVAKLIVADQWCSEWENAPGAEDEGRQRCQLWREAAVA